MNAYFLIYFDALWPQIQGDCDALQMWCFFFERLDQLAQCAQVHSIAWQPADMQMGCWLRDTDTAMMRLWLVSFLSRRKAVALCGVSQKWQSYVAQQEQYTRVTVMTAYTLTPQQQQPVISYVAQHWHNARISWGVNPQLIGGVQCIVDDIILDLSIQGSLNKIALAFGIRGYL